MLDKRLDVLIKEANFESTGYSKPCLGKFSPYIYQTAGSRVFRLFKILITNSCQNNCLYCGIRARRNCERYFLKPKDLANIFMQLYKARKVDGIFVSSGIYKNSDYSQSLILDTVYILRKKYQFRGYVHAKVLPSADSNIIRSLSFLANRVSINLEAPTKDFFKRICPDKEFKEGIFKPLGLLSFLDKKKAFSSGITSQLVVGASNELDKDILNTADLLYDKFSLRRVYYSGFIPIRNTPLENRKAVSSMRQLRLYQADILMRSYGFKADEIIFNDNGNLALDKDPKLNWANRNRDLFPMDINRVDEDLLKRIPGIGIKSAEKIRQFRKQQRIKSLDDLKKIGISINRAKGWIRFS